MPCHVPPSLAAPRHAWPGPAMPALPRLAAPGPAVPRQASPSRAMPRHAAPGLAEPCLPSPPYAARRPSPRTASSPAPRSTGTSSDEDSTPRSPDSPRWARASAGAGASRLSATMRPCSAPVLDGISRAGTLLPAETIRPGGARRDLPPDLRILDPPCRDPFHRRFRVRGVALPLPCPEFVRVRGVVGRVVERPLHLRYPLARFLRLLL